MESGKHALIGQYNAKCHLTIGQEIIVSSTDWLRNRSFIFVLLHYDFFTACCMIVLICINWCVVFLHY
jgi:hypothetical protein